MDKILARGAVFSLSLVFVYGASYAQSGNSAEFRSPAEFFPKDRPQVLVVGTFHFNYPGLDAHQTADADKIDVLREPKRSELTELVEYIKRFKPNKVAIEAKESWDANGKLAAYRRGELEPSRDERYQLGFRIADELSLESIYSVDAGSFADDLEKLDKEFSEQLFEGYDWKSDDPLDASFGDWLAYSDQVKKDSRLLDYFIYLNSRENHDYTNGVNLIGDFQLGEHRGADALAVYWYNRNLRIFRKIQDISESETDRILLIMGNGHAALMRHFLESSPAYEFIEFESL